MMSDARIDGFAKGWVAQGVRYEPIERLQKCMNLSALLTAGFLVLLVASIVFGFGAWAKFKVLRLDILLSFLTLVMGFSAFQMGRFIRLRKAVAAESV